MTCRWGKTLKSWPAPTLLTPDLPAPPSPSGWTTVNQPTASRQPSQVSASSASRAAPLMKMIRDLPTSHPGSPASASVYGFPKSNQSENRSLSTVHNQKSSQWPQAISNWAFHLRLPASPRSPAVRPPGLLVPLSLPSVDFEIFLRTPRLPCWCLHTVIPSAFAKPFLLYACCFSTALLLCIYSSSSNPFFPTRSSLLLHLFL